MNWLKGVLLRLAAKFNRSWPHVARRRHARPADERTGAHRERRSSESWEILSRLDEVRQAQARERSRTDAARRRTVQ